MSSLDERRRIREQELEAERRRRAGQRARFLASVLAIVVLSGVMAIGYRMAGERRGAALEEAPAEVLGTWTTDMERYSGASLTIEPEQITLGFAPGAQEAYRIRSIRQEVAAVHRAYIITYEDGQGVQEMEIFVYDDGQLRLKNPFDAVWRRVE